MEIDWLALLAYFFGGAFFANAIPHTVAGMMGHAFQSPFAKPPGQGQSSATVNVLWGFANLVIAYLLLVRVGAFDVHNWMHIGVTTAGALAISTRLASHFGRFNGGNDPRDG